MKPIFFFAVFICLFSGIEVSGANYYWVGDSGNWSDISHWATTSGGTVNYTQIPTFIDDVFFDAKSFTGSNQTVTVNIGNAVCCNMDWTGSKFTPAFTGSNDIRIYGSLTMLPNMHWDYTGQVYFEATTSGKTITSAGHWFQNSIYFQGIGGGWNLEDSCSVNNTLFLVNGTLNTNNQKVNCRIFNSDNTNIRTLLLGNSLLSIVNDYWYRQTFILNGTNCVLNASSSKIKILDLVGRISISGTNLLKFNELEYTNKYTSDCGNISVLSFNAPVAINKITLSGGPITIAEDIANISIGSMMVNDECEKSILNASTGNYSINSLLCNANTNVVVNADSTDNIQNIFFHGNKGTINGAKARFQKVEYQSSDGDINGDNTFDTLSFSPGRVYTLQEGATQTINENLIANGSCTDRITIKSSLTGKRATISKTAGNINLAYILLQDIRSTGGAVFIANNSVDMGNNTGWTINGATAQNLYWVGGTGNWNNSAHWDTISGGPGGACVPSPFNNVFFDSKSFTAINQTVTVNIGNAVCRDMDWTGSKFTPAFTGSNDIRIYGSLTMVPNMHWDYTGQVYFEATTSDKTITSAGQTFQNNILFQGIGGGWSLADSCSVNNTLFLVNGTLNTNNQKVNCRIFNSDNTNIRTLLLGNSLLSIVNDYWYRQTFILNGNNCDLNAASSKIRILDFVGRISISGNNLLKFNELEYTNKYTSDCGNISVLSFNAPVAINKITLSGGPITIAEDIANISIGSIMVNDECEKSILNASTGNYSINSLLCNANTNVVVNADSTDNIQNIFFHGNKGTINGAKARFQKVEFQSSDGDINGNNTFDTLSFSPGRIYTLQERSTQTIDDSLCIRGNGCFPLTLRSSVSGVQSNIYKSSGIVSADYVELRDQNASGAAAFYAGNFSRNVTNNTGWIFNNATGYSYGLGADTSFCSGSNMVLNTVNFNGGIAWHWKGGSTGPTLTIDQPGTYWVTVNYAGSCFITDSVHVGLRQTPVVTSCNDTSVCVGDIINLKSVGGETYKWTGPNGYTSSEQNPVILNAAFQNTGNYFVVTTSDNCESKPDSTNIKVNTGTLPVGINISVSANSICAGQTVTFTATTSNGGTNPIYQWKLNGIDVGISSSTYTTNLLNNSDSIWCVFISKSNCADPATNPAMSNKIRMTVNPVLPVSVSIVADQNNICQGSMVTFTATPVNGGSAPVYQWKVNGNNIGTNVSKFSYVPANGDNIFCRLTSNVGCTSDNPAMSNNIAMKVIPISQVGVSISADQNNICQGTNVQFTASPTNGGIEPVYQWKVNGTNVGTDNPEYSYIPDNNDIVICDLTSDVNCPSVNPATSNSISMLVNEILPVNISVIADRNNVCQGTTVLFTATPTNGGSAPVYKWQVNGIQVGVNSSTHSYVPDSGDMVTCILTSNYLCPSANRDTSNEVLMTVNQITPVSVSIVADQNNVCQGTNVLFTATPTNGGTAPVYDWQVNGLQTGNNAATYSFIPANGDIVACNLVSNVICASVNPATSNAISILINPILPVAVSIAAGQNNVCQGTNVLFTATPTNGGITPDYEWQVNGVQIDSKASTYSFFPANGDIVTCNLMSDVGCASGNPATSNAVTMLVNPILPVGVSIVPDQNNVCQGSNVLFTATTINGGTVPVYEWLVNGLQTGTNASMFSYVPDNGDMVTCNLTSNYNCVSGNPAKSNAISMAIIPTVPVSVGIIADKNNYCEISSVNYTANPINGGTSPVFQWQVNGITEGTNSSIFSYVPSDGDEVTCNLTSSVTCGSYPALSNAIIMSISPITEVSVTISAEPGTYINKGENITFTARPDNEGTAPFYQWQVNGTNAGSNNPVFNTYSLNNGDIITCILTSNLNCITGNPAASNAISVIVNSDTTNNEAGFQMPNAFMPGEDGPSAGYYEQGDHNNAIFRPVIKHDILEDYQMQVFNRWGNLLFETDDINRGWDGYYNGRLCPQGAYVWRIKYVINNGQKIIKTGNVTLIQ
jgi:gliding motility-associated-like protein